MNNPFRDPRDLQAAQQAAPQEQAELANDPFSGKNHASLPGSPANEPYAVGTDYQGLASQEGFSTGVGIGVESGQEGLAVDPMGGVYPNPIVPFPNIAPTPPNVTGFDSMQGVTYPAIPVSYSNENMYWDGVHEGPVGFHQANNVQPENTPAPGLLPE